jgi:hypothetical protein
LLSGRSRALGGPLTWFARAFPLKLPANDRKGSDADSEVETAARLASGAARRIERPWRPTIQRLERGQTAKAKA